MKKSLLLAMAVVVVVVGLALEPAVPQGGRHFTYTVPSGWKESVENGVIILSTASQRGRFLVFPEVKVPPATPLNSYLEGFVKGWLRGRPAQVNVQTFSALGFARAKGFEDRSATVLQESGAVEYFTAFRDGEHVGVFAISAPDPSSSNQMGEVHGSFLASVGTGPKAVASSTKVPRPSSPPTKQPRPSSPPTRQPPATPSAPPTKQPPTVTEKIQVTGTFKYASREEGPQDPSNRFGAYEDIHCGIRGTLKKGSTVEALLRDQSGRPVMKMTFGPQAQDVTLDKYAIPFRHPKQAFAPGDYSLQVLLNNQDVGRPLKVTISGAEPKPDVADSSMKDLIKRETSTAIRSAVTRPGQRYALLIGVGQYENGGVQKLQYPVEDVKAVRSILQDPASGGFAAANVHVLTDAQATLAGIGSQLVWLRGVCTESDTALIYFTGHGYSNGNRSYLGTVNTDPDNLNFTALSVAKFNEGVALIKAKKKIIILDACHSGGMLIAARGDDKLSPQMAHELNERAEGEVRLLSCSKDETSKEDPKLGHGVFTHFLVKGMGPGKAADENNDGVVTVGELYAYLSKQVRTYGAERGYIQTPSAEQKVTAGVIIMSTRWK